jgi:glutathione synthase
MLAQYAGQPIVIQAYLAGVRFGDKRIFLLDGEPIGAVNRVPRSADSLANIHQGARVEATELSARERQIAAEVGSFLRQQGLWLAGLDVIDGYLTEVNVTSPSALRQINAVSNAHLERAVVDFLERAAAQKRTAALASYRSGA